MAGMTASVWASLGVVACCWLLQHIGGGGGSPRSRRVGSWWRWDRSYGGC